jgi:hypothetical protein
MAVIGGYGPAGGEALPRILQISIARYQRALPKKGAPLEFLVSIHEEGTGVTFQRNARVSPEAERKLLDATAELYLWSVKLGSTPDRAALLAHQVGEELRRIFVGESGDEFLADVKATTILLGVDETVLNLPWELMTSNTGVSMLEIPFGRIVTTRQVPERRRDPLTQDRTVRVLLVVNPTSDLGATASELEAVMTLESGTDKYKVKVDVLEQADATKKRFKEAVATSDYDIIHFAGHASFNPSSPERSALRFADGRLEADEIHTLDWPDAPGFVFNSACGSGRAGGGRRLVGKKNRANGLAAAFLAAGVGGYAGYFWPVTDVGASLFAHTFYEAAFRHENIGLGFMEARQETFQQLGDKKDLTCFSAVLFGDAAAGERQDLMRAE